MGEVDYDAICANRKAAREAAMVGHDMAKIRSEALKAAVSVSGQGGNPREVLNVAEDFIDFLIGYHL